MKKLFSISALAVAIMLFTSCEKMMEEHKKHDEVKVYKTVDVTILANETYTYNLPVNNSEDDFKITTQASHFRVSSLETEAATGNRIYQYTPSVNFRGDDTCVISTDDEQYDGEGHDHNGCHPNHEEDQDMVITIHIHVIAGSIIKPINSAL